MKKSFFVKGLLRFTIPLLVPLIILGGFSIVATTSYVRNELDTNNYKMLEQTRNTIELLFKELDSVHYTLNYNSRMITRIRSLLTGNEASPSDIEALSNVMTIINAPTNIRPHIHSIYLYYDNAKNNFLVSNEGRVNFTSYNDKTWLERIHSMKQFNKERDIETRKIKRYAFDRSETDVVTLYRRFVAPGQTKTEGYIVANLRSKALEQSMEKLLYQKQQQLFIVNSNKEIIASTTGTDYTELSNIANMDLSETHIYESAISKQNYVVSKLSSNEYDLEYISVTPRKGFYQLSNNLLYVTIVLVLVSLVLGIILTHYIARRDHRNLFRILRIISHAEQGMPLPQLPEKVTDENSFILQSMIKSFVERSSLKIQLTEKKYMLQMMELMALQSNINPHFMANTLQTIFWKAVALTGGQNEVSRMIDHLTGVVHYAISTSNKKVTLEEEIYNTNNYTEIMKIRYKDKFQLEWDYQDEVLYVTVMKLLLQPLIENAIYHGIKESERFGRIRIKIRKQQGKLYIAIVDTGLGMDRQRLMELRQLFTSEEEPKRIGLYNTYKRLQIIYANQHSFRIRSKLGWGTMIELVLPIDED
ncbi:sensor histidine kinase [Paenibacillus sp. IITD108]|uniref:sensor histidine kinase n=1 Tax=Paenibacillus sp. IITD108 TaxID=3116649 RepID=UPI002F40C36E